MYRRGMFGLGCPLFTVALAASTVGGAPKTDPNLAFIGADDPNIQYTGRIGLVDPKAPTFHYSASQFRTRFTGTSLVLRFEDKGYGPANSFGIRIDGGHEIPLFLFKHEDHSYVVAVGLAGGTHDLLVYRRQDAVGGTAAFRGFWLDKGAMLKAPPARPKRRMEFFGDSVLSGAVVEAVGYEGQSDDNVSFAREEERLTNGYWSFGSVTARMLHAEAHVNGIGGLSLMDKTGWWGGEPDECKGLETTFDKTNPINGQYEAWDFTRFIPHVVVLSVGQNDYRGADVHDKVHMAKWEETYLGVLAKLHAHYPKATFVLTTTILMHDLEWDEHLKAVAQDANRKLGRVVYYGFKRVGKGTPGHLRITEDHEMALELSHFIDGLKGVWDE